MKLAEQTEPQLMPAGVLLRVPLPDLVTLRRLVAGAKVATTVFAALMVTEQVLPLALLQPVQPEST